MSTEGGTTSPGRQEDRNLPRPHPRSVIGWAAPYCRTIEVIITRSRVILRDYTPRVGELLLYFTTIRNYYVTFLHLK